MSDFDDLDNLSSEEISRYEEERASEILGVNIRRLKEWNKLAHSDGRDGTEYDYSLILGEDRIFKLSMRHMYFIVHFAHESFKMCTKLDEHLKILSKTLAKSIKFAKIFVENAPFFVSKFQIRVLPTCLLIKRGKIIARMKGYEPITKNADLSTNELFMWITSKFMNETETVGRIF